MRVATTVKRAELDNRLVRAMREGAAVLPEDLDMLRGYLRLIEGLLAEKAVELEPDWPQVCASAAEIQTLQSLEAVVAERAIGVRASDVSGVRLKLEIWRDLLAGAEDTDMTTASNRLILSIAEDLEQFQKSGG